MRTKEEVCAAAAKLRSVRDDPTLADHTRHEAGMVLAALDWVWASEDYTVLDINSYTLALAFEESINDGGGLFAGKVK